MEIIGKYFGRLKVLKYSHTNKYYVQYFECICKCKAVCTVRGSSLLSGWTRSCGCLKLDLQAKRMRYHNISIAKHNLSGTPTYNSWFCMKQRCLNPNSPNYKYYGGRGIRICKRWLHSFVNFVSDMGTRPKDQTLDRIDSNGNYSPSNCRWATIIQQRHNRRQTLCLNT